MTSNTTDWILTIKAFYKYNKKRQQSHYILIPSHSIAKATVSWLFLIWVRTWVSSEKINCNHIFYDKTTSEKKIVFGNNIMCFCSLPQAFRQVSLKYATGGSLNIQFSSLVRLISVLNFEWSNYFAHTKSNADLNWFGCPYLT